MSDNDLIKRGEVRKLAAPLETEDGEILVVDMDDVDEIPAVPQEMSAREYIREYRRMHSFYFGKPATDGGMNGCGDCPGRLNGKKNCIFSPTRDESSIPIVEAWAQAHPEERSEE